MDPANRNVIDVFLQPGDFFFGSPSYRIRTLLGSCVSIIMWHRQRQIGGMCHFLLPERRAHGEGGLDGRYAGEALQLFLQEIRGAGTAAQEYEVKLIGGGRQFTGGMDIGQRNIDMARRLLREHGLSVHGEHLAGVGYRHVVFDIETGVVLVKAGNAPSTSPTQV